jgi:hypothetical protein
MKHYNYCRPLQDAMERALLKPAYGVMIDPIAGCVAAMWKVPARYTKLVLSLTCSDLDFAEKVMTDNGLLLLFREPIDLDGVVGEAVEQSFGSSDAYVIEAIERIKRERINTACYKAQRRKEVVACSTRSRYWSKRALTP